MMLQPALNDVAVLFIFFARPKQTQTVFEQIKKARPSKLFLYQDGARKGRPDDVENVAKCREIVEQIDWECDVHRLYQTENKGCDPSEYISQKWMFSVVEKGIVLEDDDVPSQSFFPFCKELLDRYEHDDRINMICGMNNVGSSADRCPNSYFFTCGGSIWGWATWRRNIDKWDPDYSFLKDDYTVNLIRNLEGKRADGLFERIGRHRATGKEHYESILGAHRILEGQFNIVPTLNLITNIGIDQNTTHSVADINLLPPKSRKLLYKERYELEFPLKHPKYMIMDKVFEAEVNDSMHVNLAVRIIYKIKRIFYKLICKK